MENILVESLKSCHIEGKNIYGGGVSKDIFSLRGLKGIYDRNIRKAQYNHAKGALEAYS